MAPPGLAFHPLRPTLATVGSDPGIPTAAADRLVHIWELDFDLLLAQTGTPPVSYTSAKTVLVGDSGVGKTGLGWRLAHGELKEHASTHGQQFWVLDRLNTSRPDRARCEAVLWDLAGQPDYRLIHALFLDDADLALVLFDPTDSRDPLHGAEFWLKQLNIGQPSRRCESGNISTSAKEGEGMAELIARRQALIPWDEKPATVTTDTFKRVKDHVLALKENREAKQVIVSPQALRAVYLPRPDLRQGAGDPDAGVLHQLRLGRSAKRALGGTESSDRPAKGRHGSGPGPVGEREDRGERFALRRANR